MKILKSKWETKNSPSRRKIFGYSKGGGSGSLCCSQVETNRSDDVDVHGVVIEVKSSSNEGQIERRYIFVFQANALTAFSVKLRKDFQFASYRR